MHGDEFKNFVDRLRRVFPSACKRLDRLIDLCWFASVEFSDEGSWADRSQPVFCERSGGEVAKVLRDDSVALGCEGKARDVLVLWMDTDDFNLSIAFTPESIRKVGCHRSDRMLTKPFGVDVWEVGEYVAFEFLKNLMAPSQLEGIEPGEGQYEVA